MHQYLICFWKCGMNYPETEVVSIPFRIGTHNFQSLTEFMKKKHDSLHKIIAFSEFHRPVKNPNTRVYKKPINLLHA